MSQNDEKPSEEEKRRIYIIFFCVALVVDLGISTFRGEAYRPTLFGLAIMIASVLFFLWSWIRSR
ncbi:MAG TPA: hypothetical protein DCS82_10370 [Rhodospirillaceae bacterium]|mgnify:CR=1|nr:hypothetical protein [Rhodospirillaceae bacterium]HAA91841.1 hypothetical protein [Rhodospirillaceae bacterium]HAT36112.1 hypothetical protein [Rhodospirillaceae bacterium]|tara:strand:+ start:774 stop:968 length:195 start_codon:yes stop_codon:yes gene_type:complete